MKTKRISQQEGCAGLEPTPAPPGMPQARWARGMPEGQREGKALAWYRGEQAGRFDAVLSLQELGHPRIADKLRRHYRMDAEGSVTYG